ncbi:hypothetical protein [Kutzneria sp. 744]|uniref:DUF6907 domain-containing protein n=1 Tax=Kutzneria sp. (strain 744) TaxID=345341 RepID=UPI0003EEDEEB|nr:hypothetical protein [Kutzneria sp. 744]EWM10019.1 hypothetical protein KUTG_00323 [Kutzneria sp. 744]
MTNTIADVSRLTPDQRAGHACVSCHRSPVVAKSVGKLDGIHLIACDDRRRNLCAREVYWLETPCPRWCSGDHHDDDMTDDRTHFSDWQGVVLLTLEDGVRMTSSGEHDRLCQAEYVSVSLEQGAREVSPQIWCGKGGSSTGWHLTVEEAREFATVLNEAASLADAATPCVTSQEAPAVPTVAATQAA